jgi:hypothetical protein
MGGLVFGKKVKNVSVNNSSNMRWYLLGSVEKEWGGVAGKEMKERMRRRVGEWREFGNEEVRMVGLG